MRLTLSAIVVLIIFQFSFAKFDPCRFNFGYKEGTANINEADIIAQYTWAGASITDDIINMLNKCKSSNKTPALYMYIIAKSSGLGDCNTGGGLCSQGANYIRNNKEKIKQYYRDYASAIKNTFGTTDPVICVMEPDYYQYAQPGSQSGNPLSFQEAGQFMGDLIDILKAQLPNAIVSMDISPWMEDQGTTNSYLSALPLNKIDMISTSGGIAQAGSSLIKRENRLTWQKVYDITKKCILADCGYGAGGGGTGHDAAWDNVTNINNRINEGVIGIIQFSPKQDWGNTIRSISSQLSKPICPCGNIGTKKFTLTVSAGSNGRVTKNPDATSYDSGTTVTLTAMPNPGYKFKNWGGDASGTNTTITVVMNKDKNISATFVEINAKPAFSLTINTIGSGVVEVSPKQTDFDSGTIVTLQAFTVNGSSFLGWSGALSGTATIATLIMDSDKTVTASFTGNNITIVNLVKNGDFSEGATNWNMGTYEGARASGAVSDGAYKITIEGQGSEPWHIQFSQTGIKLKQNEKYKFSFTAYAQCNTSIIANIGMSAEPYKSYCGEKTIELTTTKKTYEFEFTMTEPTTDNARVEFNSGRAACSWQIDDISVAVALQLKISDNQAIPDKLNSEIHHTYRYRNASISFYDCSGRLIGFSEGDIKETKRQNNI